MYYTVLERSEYGCTARRPRPYRRGLTLPRRAPGSMVTFIDDVLIKYGVSYRQVVAGWGADTAHWPPV